MQTTPTYRYDDNYTGTYIELEPCNYDYNLEVLLKWLKEYFSSRVGWFEKDIRFYQQKDNQDKESRARSPPNSIFTYATEKSRGSIFPAFLLLKIF